MELMGLPSFISHEPMVQISAQSVEAIVIYWFFNARYQIWVLMVVRENDLECFLKVLI